MVRGSTVLLVAVCLLALGIWVSVALAAKPVTNATSTNSSVAAQPSNSTNSTYAQKSKSQYGQFAQTVLAVAVVVMIVIFLALSRPRRDEYLAQEEQPNNRREQENDSNRPHNEY